MQVQVEVSERLWAELQDVADPFEVVWSACAELPRGEVEGVVQVGGVPCWASRWRRGEVVEVRAALLAELTGRLVH